MINLKHIASKFFKSDGVTAGGGLFATVEELVAQRRYAYQWQLTNRHHFTSEQAGDVKSAFKGRGMEFEEIRAYTFGDDVRDIDWRVTARKQLPYTKLYAEEKDREVYVLLDLSPQMLFGTKKELKSVTAAKIAARIGWQCLKNKDRFGCVLSDGEQTKVLKAQNSQVHMMLIFKQIADTTQQILQRHITGTTNYLRKSLSLLEQVIKHRAIVFVISDFADFSDETSKILAQLAKKADVTCVNVFDRLEKCPPAAGEYMVQQDRQQLVFSSENKNFRKEYETYFLEKHRALQNFCKRFHLRYVESFETICE